MLFDDPSVLFEGPFTLSVARPLILVVLFRKFAEPSVLFDELLVLFDMSSVLLVDVSAVPIDTSEVLSVRWKGTLEFVKFETNPAPRTRSLQRPLQPLPGRYMSEFWLKSLAIFAKGGESKLGTNERVLR